ncbi:MAG: hypothetical protein ABIV47_02150 [Roseiflexaceae bacterium]
MQIINRDGTLHQQWQPTEHPEGDRPGSGRQVVKNITADKLFDRVRAFA